MPKIFIGRVIAAVTLSGCLIPNLAQAQLLPAQVNCASDIPSTPERRQWCSRPRFLD